MKPFPDPWRNHVFTYVEAPDFIEAPDERAAKAWWIKTHICDLAQRYRVKKEILQAAGTAWLAGKWKLAAEMVARYYDLDIGRTIKRATPLSFMPRIRHDGPVWEIDGKADWYDEPDQAGPFDVGDDVDYEDDAVDEGDGIDW